MLRPEFGAHESATGTVKIGQSVSGFCLDVRYNQDEQKSVITKRL